MLKKFFQKFCWCDWEDTVIVYGCIIALLVFLAIPGCWGGNG